MEKPNCVVADRQRYIGGSDIPAILGISRFKTRWELLQEKAGLKAIEQISNPYIEYGNEMESKIRFYINRNQAIPFVEESTTFEERRVRVNVDGINESTVLEIKTTSSNNIKANLEDYKEYLAQELFYMHYKNREQGILAIYERPEDFNTTFDPNRLHTFNFHINDFQKFLNDILEAVDKFIFDIDKLIENPELTEEDFQDNSVMSLVNQLELIEQELVHFEALKTRHEELKEALYNSMLKTNTKSFQTNNGLKITRVDGKAEKTEIIDKFNEAKFKAENEELYTKYIDKVEKTTKATKGYVKITTPKETN